MESKITKILKFVLLIAILTLFLTGCSTTTVTKNKEVNQEISSQLQEEGPLVELLSLDEYSFTLKIRNNYNKQQEFTIKSLNQEFFNQQTITFDPKETKEITIKPKKLNRKIENKIKVLDSNSNTYAIIKLT